MLELGDAYIALPGGPGTLEEISEAISASRLRLHRNPCIFVNTDGYYEPLRQQFQIALHKIRFFPGVFFVDRFIHIFDIDQKEIDISDHL